MFNWNTVNSVVMAFPAPTAEVNGTQHNTQKRPSLVYVRVIQQCTYFKGYSDLHFRKGFRDQHRHMDTVSVCPGYGRKLQHKKTIAKEREEERERLRSE